MLKKMLEKFKKPQFTINAKVKKILLICFVSLLVSVSIFLFKNKLLSVFFVAKVGDQYISRRDFDRELNTRYARSVLDNMSTLQIVSQELSKNKIEVSDESLNKKIAQIEASLGGSKIDDVLSAQGVSKPEFLTQLKLQLGAEELVKNKIVITDAEIDDFIKENGNQLVSIFETDKREEAKNIIKEQKIQSEIAAWLSDLKTKYTVTQF